MAYKKCDVCRERESDYIMSSKRTTLKVYLCETCLHEVKMADKAPIQCVCQICHEVIRTTTERSSGILLAFHLYDQHGDVFQDCYSMLTKSHGDTVLGNRSEE